MQKTFLLEYKFLIIGFIIGCLFIFVVPPFQSPDEDSHFKKAYVISNGDFFPTTDNSISGFYLPIAMQDYISDKTSRMGDLDWKYNYSDLYYDQLLSSDFSSQQLYNFSTVSITPIAHLIPAFGILLAKIFSPVFISGSGSIPVADMLYFARFTSLISYLLLGFFSIKIAPIFKKSICAILLLPMSMFLGSMVSYDGLLISIVALAFALIMNLIYNKKCLFSMKYFGIFVLIGYILLNIKIVYFPLLLLLIFVPKEKFSKNNKIKYLTLLLVSILCLTFLFKIPYLLLPSNSVSLASQQIHFVLSHPFYFLYVLLSNIYHQFWTQLYWMIGTFGLLDTYLPPLAIVLCLINLLFIFILDASCGKKKISIKIKIISLLSLSFSIFAIFSAMYIDWTPKVLNVIGGNIITGVQGRYFLPLLVFIPILLSNTFLSKKINFTKENVFFDLSLLVIIIVLCLSILMCIIRFWI